LAQLIESKGGRVLDLITDAIAWSYPDNTFPIDFVEDGKILSAIIIKIRHPSIKSKRLIVLKLKNKQMSIECEIPTVKDNYRNPLMNQTTNLNKSFSLQAPAAG
jgi:hypothetical protein